MATGWGQSGAWGPGGGGAWTAPRTADPEDVQPQVPQQDFTKPAPPSAPAFGQSAGGAYANAYAGGTSAAAGGFGGAGGGGPMTEADLKAKEKELQEREKRIKAREVELERLGADYKPRNWPICRPCLHHDIAGEIPEKSRRVVREGYLVWWGLCLCLSFNLFCASVVLGYDNAKQKVGSWFLAVIYWGAGIPLGFWLWYLCLYRAAKNDSAFGFVRFFVWFSCHCAFVVWAAIAVPFSTNQWSFAGFMTAFVNGFDLAPFVGIIYLVGASLWTVEACASLWTLYDAFLFFRGQGGIQQAKQDAAVAAFKHNLRG